MAVAGLRPNRWPVTISVVSVITILAITVGLVLDARRDVESRTRETSWNLLRAIQRDVGRNVEILNLSLDAVIDGLLRPEIMLLPAEVRNQVLFDRSATASGVGALTVFDDGGVLRIDSTSVEPHVIKPVTDRDFFQAQRDGDAGLFISQPYMSRLTKMNVVGLSRRWSRADGGFAGIALATIQIAYFEELFRSLHLDPGTILTLFRNDGAVLLRLEPNGFRIGGSFASSPVFQTIRQRGSGDFVGVSSSDGVERLYSFTRVGDLPLILSIGIPTATVYGNWAQKTVLVLVALTLISGLLIVMCLRLSRELGRRAEAEAKLIDANIELGRLTETDALTALGNRRHFDQILARETKRAARADDPLSLILLDVDQFKSFNDRYGHPSGDAALRGVAGVLRERARRPGDMAFRIGGEEFALLLGATDLQGARLVMEEIRLNLRLLALPHDGSPTGLLTVSQGAAEIKGDDALGAVTRADLALYQAKRDGRDRAYLATSQIAV